MLLSLYKPTTITILKGLLFSPLNNSELDGIFSIYFTCRCGSVTVPTLEFDYSYIFIYTTLTFFSVLSPSHFILALLQSCFLSVVLIKECE